MNWDNEDRHRESPNRVVGVIPGYLYDTLREVVYPGTVEIWSRNFSYKTVHSRFYGPKGHSFLVSEEEGEFYRGVFWLRERNDNLANSLTIRYQEEKIDKLRDEYTNLMDKADEIKTKLDKAYDKLGVPMEFKLGGEENAASNS